MSSGSSRSAIICSRILAMSRATAGAGRRDAHALEHQGRLVLGDGVLEGDVARREPHLLVAALVLEAGLVAGVRLVEALAQVLHGRAGDVLVERTSAGRG